MRTIGNTETPKVNYENETFTEGRGYFNNRIIDRDFEVKSTHSVVLAGPIDIIGVGNLIINGNLTVV